MNKTAIILGATGLTGGLLLENLLKDKSYSQIKLFLRKSTGITHSKIKEYIGDIVQLNTFEADFKADEVFCCIGTTKAKTKDQEVYKAIDFGIPMKAAQLAKQNNIPFLAVVSALGANVSSTVFYNRTKGEMEREVLAQKIEHTYILRPALIKGNRTESRFGEKMGSVIFSVLDMLLVGPFKKYQSIRAKAIADAMWKLPNSDRTESIILSDEIKRISEL